MRAFNSVKILQSFQVGSGGRQGCVMAPTLFAFSFVALLQSAFVGNEDGTYLRTRFEGSLFSLRRLKAGETTEVLIRE